MLWIFFVCLLGLDLGSDPDNARLVTEDIDRFWQAYDAVQEGANPESTFQKLYFDPGSSGLKAFIENRIGSVAELLAVVNAHPEYYKGIRANTMKVKELDPQIRAVFAKLKTLYGEAVFPDVYFMIGRMNSGGTIAPTGLLIGTEVYAMDDGTPKHELNDWARSAFGDFEELPYIVAHELIHFQQKNNWEDRSLLARSLHEGIADFMCEKIAGKHINDHIHAFGNSREAEVWRRFKSEMEKDDTSQWLYNGTNATADWPADLGYYVGYKIAEAYYLKSPDKKVAVTEILGLKDTISFLKESGYGSQLD